MGSIGLAEASDEEELRGVLWRDRGEEGARLLPSLRVVRRRAWTSVIGAAQDRRDGIRDGRLLRPLGPLPGVRRPEEGRHAGWRDRRRRGRRRRRAVRGPCPLPRPASPAPGCMDVDVFDAGGELMVLEINARFGGGYPFLARRGGGHAPRAGIVAARRGVRFGSSCREDAGNLHEGYDDSPSRSGYRMLTGASSARRVAATSSSPASWPCSRSSPTTTSSTPAPSRRFRRRGRAPTLCSSSSGGCGKTAINVFVLITGYFMCEKDFRWRRVAKLVFQNRVLEGRPAAALPVRGAASQGGNQGRPVDCLPATPQRELLGDFAPGLPSDTVPQAAYRTRVGRTRCGGRPPARGRHRLVHVLQELRRLHGGLLVLRAVPDSGVAAALPARAHRRQSGLPRPFRGVGRTRGRHGPGDRRTVRCVGGPRVRERAVLRRPVGEGDGARGRPGRVLVFWKWP